MLIFFKGQLWGEVAGSGFAAPNMEFPVAGASSARRIPIKGCSLPGQSPGPGNWDPDPLL
jgi:hypothetical protein